jgi:preprotein translocase subunit SecF
MASLGSAILFVLLLISSAIVDHIFKYAFLVGISTGIMSSYYES